MLQAPHLHVSGIGMPSVRPLFEACLKLLPIRYHIQAGGEGEGGEHLAWLRGYRHGSFTIQHSLGIEMGVRRA